jgi:L-lactate dehydrogenase complex protein LldF
MKIPLPKMMRHWREREWDRGLNPPRFRAGLKFWAFFARRPALYRFGTGLAAWLLRLWGGGKPAFAALPLAGGWTGTRDFPVPEGRTFQSLWAEQRRGN